MADEDLDLDDFEDLYADDPVPSAKDEPSKTEPTPQLEEPVPAPAPAEEFQTTVNSDGFHFKADGDEDSYQGYAQQSSRNYDSKPIGMKDDG